MEKKKRNLEEKPQVRAVFDSEDEHKYVVKTLTRMIDLEKPNGGHNEILAKSRMLAAIFKIARQRFPDVNLSEVYGLEGLRKLGFVPYVGCDFENGFSNQANLKKSVDNPDNFVRRGGIGWKMPLEIAGLAAGAALIWFLFKVNDAAYSLGKKDTGADRAAEWVARGLDFHNISWVMRNRLKRDIKFWEEVTSWPEPVRCWVEGTENIYKHLNGDNILEKFCFPRNLEGNCENAFIFYRGERFLNAPPEERAIPLFDYDVFSVNIPEALKKILNENFNREGIRRSESIETRLYYALSLGGEPFSAANNPRKSLELRVNGEEQVYLGIYNGDVGVFRGEDARKYIDSHSNFKFTGVKPNLSGATFVLPRITEKGIGSLFSLQDYVIMLSEAGEVVFLDRNRHLLANTDLDFTSETLESPCGPRTFYFDRENILLRFYDSASDHLDKVFPIPKRVCEPLFRQEATRIGYLEISSMDLEYARNPWINPGAIDIDYTPVEGGRQVFRRGMRVEKNK